MDAPPLELTEQQVEHIRALLNLEYKDGSARLILGMVRRKPYDPEDNRTGVYQLAFCLVSHDTGVKVLDLIEESKRTRYPPDGLPKVRKVKDTKKPLPEVVG